ncbi:MAG: PTS glucose transporter subunit IIA [Mycoplasmatales bacterium]|nr:PTS glucose transporter subunit IIA [Mycoplasmatales bacterium]
MSFQSTNVWARGVSWTWDGIFIIVLFSALMVLLSLLKWTIKLFKKDEELPFKKNKITISFFVGSIIAIMFMTIGETIWRIDAFYGVSTFYVAYWWHYLVFTIFTYILVLIVWIIKAYFTNLFPGYKQELINFKNGTISLGKGIVNGTKNAPQYFSKKINILKIKQQERYFNKKSKKIEVDILVSPVEGEIVELSKVDDPAFSQGLLGQGIAILPEPKETTFSAPVSGKITTIFPTNHAYGLETPNGTSILVHIGIDTVKLKGQYFESFVKQGDYVKSGQDIIKANLAEIAKKKYNITTMVVCTPETKGELQLKNKNENILKNEKYATVNPLQKK